MDYVNCTKCSWRSSLFRGQMVPSDIRQESLEHVISGPCTARVFDLRRGHQYVPGEDIEDPAPVAALEVAPA